MRALIVGLGSIGRRHARNWHALGLGEILVCRATDSPQPEPLDVPSQVFRSLDAALAERPGLVVVANPTSLHVEAAARAVEAGCSVLVEKPLGASLDGVPELLAAADRNGVRVLAGYQLRFHPGLLRARALLKAGVIGAPLYARASVGDYLPGWHPWENYRDGYSARRELGGGPILTLSHDLDLLCWLLGLPSQVTCVASQTNSLQIDTEEVAEIIVRLPGGVLGTVHLDYVRQPSERYLEVVGASGTLRWEYEANRVLRSQAGAPLQEAEPRQPALDRNELFRMELLHVVDVLGGAPLEPMADGHQAAAILGIVDAAQRSAREGRTISFEPLDHSWPMP